MEQPRILKGVSDAGQFARINHSDTVPTLGRSAPVNTFADIDSVRELDAMVSDVLSPENISQDGERSAAEQSAMVTRVSADWTVRRAQILGQRRRKSYDSYATDLEDQANTMLRNAARANLRNVADDLREEFPDAATMVLEKDYDDGNLAIWVSSVQDKDGNDLPDPEDGSDDARDTAQELISQHSSRQLARFTEGPVNLEEAAGWIPPEGPRAILRD